VRQFNFGKNWLKFSEKTLDEGKLLAAQQSLVELIGQENIKGKSFLDIGCGSGIFSIAARKLGAKKVVGFDVSPESIQSAQQNRQKYLDDPEISFYVLSILKNSYKRFGRFDIVYSWGVLHHTGNMWQAMKNSADLVKDNGLFVIAIYNKHWSSPYWKLIKYVYNFSPRLIQRLMIYFFYVIILCAKFLIAFRNPYQKRRGMDFYHDVIDWVGGYPYEYADRMKIINFILPMGFKLRKSFPAPVPTGCNEFVFVKDYSQHENITHY